MFELPRYIAEEMDALSEKIATIRLLIKESTPYKSKVDAYLDWKLREYTTRYTKLKNDTSRGARKQAA